MDSASGSSKGAQEVTPGGRQGACSRPKLAAEEERPGANLAGLGRFLKILGRKKPLHESNRATHLNKCLGLFDLTALGVGSTLGLGLYVLAGQVASNKAGPAVVLSFALAALASGFSALCYAEFAGRVPSAGSAYAYSYITIGELGAFVIGWNLVLEYVIGASSVARGFSGYLRIVWAQLAGSSGNGAQVSPPEAAPISATTLGQLLNASSSAAAGQPDCCCCWWSPLAAYLGQHFDWISVAIILVVTLLLLFGVKESSNVTACFTLVNLSVVCLIVVNGWPKFQLHNWRLEKSEVPENYGDGGFLPYGWTGVLAGSATCFFGFIGFDTIASSAEEAKNPKRNVPLAITISLAVSFVAYMAVAITQTLIWPYYEQNRVTILPYIFERLHMPYTNWIVSLGALAGLASSQLGGALPLPRILYSMAQDRLIYGQLARVNASSRIPVHATCLGSLLVAALACLLDIEALADMVSIGTLAAYSIVSLSVLILRYERPQAATLRLPEPIDIVAANKGAHFVSMKMLGFGRSRAPPADGASGAGSRPQTGAKNWKHLAWNWNWNWNWNWSRRAAPQKGAPGSGVPSEREEAGDSRTRVLHLWSWPKSAQPDEVSSQQSKVLIALIVLLSLVLDLILMALLQPNLAGSSSSTSSASTLAYLACFSLASLILTMYTLSRLPVDRTSNADSFQVPWVPLVPTLSILVNIFLMLNLSYLTWVRFAVWMAAGFFIYFSYGIFHGRGHLAYEDADADCS